MLSDAGVDTLIFDTSYGKTFKEFYMTLLDAFNELRKEGSDTPKIAFMTSFGDPGKTVSELYDDLYGKGLYRDLWFYWDGKPLILANPDQIDPGLRGYFTFRWTQPSLFAGPVEPDMWSWCEVYPQHLYNSKSNEREEMSVSIAQNAVTKEEIEAIRKTKGLSEDTPSWTFLSTQPQFGCHGIRLFSDVNARGRNYHSGRNSNGDDDVLYGYNFQEQWEHVLKEDPQFVFVTGWNEWFVGRQPAPRVDLGHILIGDENIKVYFCDSFSQINSRDIEPMKGGHGDNYYYQLVDYVRKYKGARPLPKPSSPRSIDINGPFDQWKDVLPEYRDHIRDTYPRDHAGYNNYTYFKNSTGRNDLLVLRVARDEKNVYFYARTREPISSYTDPNWMMLFINMDRNHRTGWQGYNFLVNRRVKDAETATLEFTKNGWNWEPWAEVKYRVEGNELMLAVARQSLGLATDENDLEFEFKWVDNIQNEDSIDEFTLNGDSAPSGRFNYLYVANH